MQRYEMLAARLGVVVRSDWLKNDIHLTKRPRPARSVITYDYRLPAPMAIVGVGMMLGTVHFDWGRSGATEERFGLRFSPPWANHKLRQKEAEIYSGYRYLRRWLAGVLITQKMKEELAVEGRPYTDLCWMHDLPLDIVQVAYGIHPLESERIAFGDAIWAAYESGW
jgi:hypothetical protein